MTLSQMTADWCWHLHREETLEFTYLRSGRMDRMAKSVKNDKVQWSHHGDCKLNLKNVHLKLSEDFVIMTLSHNAKLGTDKNKPQEFLRGSFTPSSTHRFHPKLSHGNKLSTLQWHGCSLYLHHWRLQLCPIPREQHTHIPSGGGAEIRSAQASQSTSSQEHLPLKCRQSRARAILCSAAQGKQGTRKD